MTGKLPLDLVYISTVFKKLLITIRIYHECEGRIDKNPSRGSPFGTKRIIIMDYFSCSPLFLFIYVFI